MTDTEPEETVQAGDRVIWECQECGDVVNLAATGDVEIGGQAELPCDCSESATTNRLFGFA